MADVSSLAVNRRVTITTRNGSTFTGVLHSVDERAGKIVLKSVSTAGSKLYGPQHFYSTDMTNIQFLGGFQDINNESKSLADDCESASKKSGLTHKKMSMPHLARMRNLDTDDLVMANIFAEENGDQGIGSGEDGSTDEFEDYYETEDYTLICRICDMFFDAILHIMKQEVVGVTFEGMEIGRNGTLSLIQVATETDLIIFDMQRLGQQAFVEGLQALFESSNVLKVIHDCRWISDMMQHKYNIPLVNVFDTQVANAFVYRLINGGDWPRYVESLPGCLVSHLNLSCEQVHFMKVRERSREKDESIWLQRPIPENLLSAASKNTVYLIQLYKVLMSKMLLEFKTGVEIYMEHVNNMGGDTHKCRLNGHLLPYAFMDIQSLILHNFSDSRGARYVMRDKFGFRENVVDISDKRIVYSHDSAWHMSSEACAKAFQKKPGKITKGKPTDGGPPQERNQRKKYFMENNNNNNCSVGGDSGSHKTYNKLLSPTKKGNSGLGTSGDDNDDKQHVISCQTATSSSQTATSSSRKCVKSPSTTGYNSNASSSDIGKTFQCGDKSKKDDQEHGGGPPKADMPNASVSESPESVSDGTSNKIRRSKLFQSFIASQSEDEQNQSGVLSKQSSTPEKHSDEHVISVNETQVDTKLASGKQLSGLLIECKEQGESGGRDIDQDSSSTSSDLEAKLRLMFMKTGFKEKPKPSLGSQKLSADCPPQSSSQTGSVDPPVYKKKISSDVSPPSTDTEGSFPLNSPAAKTGLSQDRYLPAGFHRPLISKKKARRLMEQRDSQHYDECDESRHEMPALIIPETEDFGLIPMQHSLKRQQTFPLGLSAHGIGDMFSEDETCGETSKSYVQSRLAGKDEDAIRDEDIDNFQQSETFRKVLKLASSSSSKEVRSKLLPSKLKSPPAGSSKQK